MAIPSLFPLFLKAGFGASATETIIVGGLEIEIEDVVNVRVEAELSVAVEGDLLVELVGT